LAFWKSVVVGKTLAIAAHRRINLIGRKRDELRLMISSSKAMERSILPIHPTVS
jgi:hypothetical protein